jgi:hypothetical protein
MKPPIDKGSRNQKIPRCGCGAKQTAPCAPDSLLCPRLTTTQRHLLTGDRNGGDKKYELDSVYARPYCLRIVYTPLIRDGSKELFL